MAQFLVKIVSLTGSVLSENQQTSFIPQMGHSELEEACIVHLRNASRVSERVVPGFTVTFVRRRQVPNT